MTPTMRLVSPDVDQYSEQHTTALPELLQELDKTTHDKMGRHAQMLSGQVEGMLLQMLAQAIGAKRILEFGTFTGFSALMMATGLPDDGELITCDVNPDTTALAQSYWDRSPHGKKIHSKLGPATETVKTLKPYFDLVFIDADKDNYMTYYEASLALLSPNGFIAVDNVLRRGRVVAPEEPADKLQADFNRFVQEDPRVTNVILPIRDGLMLIRHKS
jgi:caffeoyl-CoA O-methyltransferase